MEKEKTEKVEKKENNIASVIKDLAKRFGEGTVMCGKETDIKVDCFPTGCLALDEAMGHGCPRGRVIELFSEASAGKSSLSQFLMGEIQKRGGKVALMDSEFSFDASYAKNLGMDVEKMLLSQPGSLEECMEIVKTLVETNEIEMIVIDSTASLVPKSELEGDVFESNGLAEQARLLSKALRVLTGAISKSKTVVIFINQLRDKVNFFAGKKQDTTGGRALKFYSSIRLEVSRGDKIEDDKKNQIGHCLKVTCVKNKVGMPWRSCQMKLMYNSGMDLIWDVCEFGISKEIIAKDGNTYLFNKKKLATSREKLEEFLKENPEILKEIRKECLKLVK